MYHSIIQHTQVLPHIILVSYGRFENTSQYTMQHHISYIGRCLLNFLLTFQSLNRNTNLTTTEFSFSTSRLSSTVDHSSCFITDTRKSICDVKHMFSFLFFIFKKKKKCTYQHNAMPTFHDFELRQLKPAYDKLGIAVDTSHKFIIHTLLHIFFLVLHGGKSTQFPLVPQAPNTNQPYII